MLTFTQKGYAFPRILISAPPWFVHRRLITLISLTVGDVVDGDDEGDEQGVVEAVVDRQDEGVAQRDAAGDVSDIRPV